MRTTSHPVTQQPLPTGRIPSRRCAKDCCKNFTKERKPFCSEHILEAGYARTLFDLVESAEAEVNRVNKRGARAIQLDGLVVEEILAGIADAGEITWKRLVKERAICLQQANERASKAYLSKLQRAGLVKKRVTRRGSDIVSLTPRGLSRAKEKTHG